ncbi:hypothetical protein COLO4_06520 [Corchorus olitorius]|uniref:Uncharacterized protein n=1 Tax=Corchorus olitorius TaxID=93759 RepID=A0A1R3KMS1_9ROSI|nr:hypothetical protein COLO4_06520 [Corchorus olitorius]
MFAFSLFRLWHGSSITKIKFLPETLRALSSSISGWPSFNGVRVGRWEMRDEGESIEKIKKIQREDPILGVMGTVMFGVKSESCWKERIRV